MALSHHHGRTIIIVGGGGGGTTIVDMTCDDGQCTTVEYCILCTVMVQYQEIGVKMNIIQCHSPCLLHPYATTKESCKWDVGRPFHRLDAIVDHRRIHHLHSTHTSQVHRCTTHTVAPW